MPRVKGGKTALKRRHNVLKKTKGYIFGRRTKERAAKQALFKAGTHAYAHRRTKKRDFRALWNIKIGAAVSAYNLSYSKFIDLLKKQKIGLDRKVLADMAENNPDSFKRIIEKVKA